MTINELLNRLNVAKKRYDGNLEVVVEMPSGYCESIHKTAVGDVVILKGGLVDCEKMALVIEPESGGLDTYGQPAEKVYSA
jgi:hypothetical protein